MGTLEKEQDVIKIFLVDGTCKGFLVTSTMTVNALKYLVAQKTNVEKSDWNNFGVYMATREKIVGPLADKPYDVHKKWGKHSGFDLRFVFKRVDEQYPAPEEDPIETTATVSTPAAGTETPTPVSPTSPHRIATHSPQTSKTAFGEPGAGSPNIFKRKITSMPTIAKTPDPTISYNTAQEASQVQSDPSQNDLGYDYNLEMGTNFEMTYMKQQLGASNEDMYSHMNVEQDTGLNASNDAFYGNMEQQNGEMPELEQPPLDAMYPPSDVMYPPIDEPAMPPTQVTEVPKDVILPGVSRTTSAQVPMKVSNGAVPKAPVRAQSTQTVGNTITSTGQSTGVEPNSPSTLPRAGNTTPKRPPPPSSLRKSGKTGVKLINTPSTPPPSTNNTTNDTAVPTPSSPKTVTNVAANQKTPASPKPGQFKMPPPANQRPGSTQITIAPPKASPKKDIPPSSPSKSSPQAQRRFLYKTEDATKSRHEQHKQIVINWINSQLACRGISIRNLTADIQDGVALIKLLEVLSEKKLEKYYGVPKMMMQKLDNLGHFLSFLRVLGIRIDGVSAEDLYVGNENLTLAILLVVLRKYGAAVPKPARRPSRTSVSGTTPRKTSTSNGTTNDSPVRKNSRTNGTNGTTPNAASPKRKTSGATSSPNLTQPRKTSNAGANGNTGTTTTATPVRKTSKTNGSTGFTMPPPAKIKAPGMPKTAPPKRPGTPQLPRKTSDPKKMPKKPPPTPGIAKPKTAVVEQVKAEDTPIDVQQPVAEAVEQPQSLIENNSVVDPNVNTDFTMTTTTNKGVDVVQNLQTAVSDVDKILEELNLGGSSNPVDAPTSPLESPKAPEEPQIDYNTDFYDHYMNTDNTLMMDANNKNGNDDIYDFSLQSSTDSTPSVMESTNEAKSPREASGSFIRSQPQGIKTPDRAAAVVDSPTLSPRGSPRTLIGQRGSTSLNSSPKEASGAIAIPAKTKAAVSNAEPQVGSPRFRHSPKPGNTKLPPHKMLMMHSPTSKYMSGSRGSGNLDSLKAASAPMLGVPGSNSNASSPVTSPTSHRKSSIVDESGNVYTEVIKLDDLEADPKDEVDPRFELDLTVKAGSKQKNSAFRDPNKTPFDLTQEIGDIDSLMENIMMTLGPSNNNVEVNWD